MEIKKTLSVKEAAAMLGMSKNGVFWRIENHDLTVIPMGNQFRLVRSEIAAIKRKLEKERQPA